jgi:hypothetical protein
MKPLMGEYRNGHDRMWAGTKLPSSKPGVGSGRSRKRRPPAKVWKRRPVTRAGSDRSKRSGPAR